MHFDARFCSMDALNFNFQLKVKQMDPCGHI